MSREERIASQKKVIEKVLEAIKPGADPNTAVKTVINGAMAFYTQLAPHAYLVDERKGDITTIMCPPLLGQRMKELKVEMPGGIEPDLVTLQGAEMCYVLGRLDERAAQAEQLANLPDDSPKQ